MARMRNAQPRNTSGSYERLFDNADLGALASKVHSALISSGYELEKMIAEVVPNNINNLDAFLACANRDDGIWLARKQQIKKSETINFEGSEPDFMVFEHHERIGTCHIVELKDGHVFDTKKAGAERRAMRKFIHHNAGQIPYRFEAHFCAFNQNDRQAIYNGFKRKIPLAEAMTGREFCDLLRINYNEIVLARRTDGPDNVEFLLSELVNIEPIKHRLMELLD